MTRGKGRWEHGGKWPGDGSSLDPTQMIPINRNALMLDLMCKDQPCSNRLNTSFQ